MASRVLITGAGGFVGPYLREHCSRQGDEVTGTTASDGPDLLDAPAWVELFARVRPDVVYHLAAWADVGGSWQQPVATFEVNANGTLHVLEAARRSGVRRVVMISSADVYGVVAPGDLPLTETATPRPSSPYGASKIAAEALAQQHHRGWGLEVVIARPFNHIGPGQSPRFATSAFADRVARCEADGGGEVRHGDLTPRRDFTDVRDVVRAYRLLAEQGRPGEIYNVCSGRSIAMSEVLQRLIDQVDVPVSHRADPELVRPVDLPVLQGSADKLHDATGWTPEVPLDRSLADILDDARKRLIDALPPTEGTPSP